MLLVDSHCHLNRLNYKTIHNNITDVLNKAKKVGVSLFLSVSTNLNDFEDIDKLANGKDNVFLSSGIHPLDLDKNNCFDYKKLYLNCSSKKRVIAVGETGLDYSRKVINKKKQQDIFRKHIQIAREVKKPLIVHSRNSFQDTLYILQEEKSEECGGILHCFTGDINIAKLLLDLNFYISFSGIITFCKSQMLLESIKYIPLDRILLETDSPYLSPIPYKKKENQPAYIYKIAECLAILKNVSIAQLSSVTTNNFCSLFNLNKVCN